MKQDEPKSMTFTSHREYERMRMFSGFRSLHGHTEWNGMTCEGRRRRVTQGV